MKTHNLILFISIFFCLSCAKEVTTIPISEKELLITPRALSNYGIQFDSLMYAGKYKKVGDIAEGETLTYKYKSNQAHDNYLYMMHKITVHPTETKASETFELEKEGFIKGLTRRSDLKDFPSFNYGQESTSYLLKNKDGEEYGNLFVCRNGKYVFFFVMSGFHFDKADKFKEFILPKLQKLDQYVKK